MASAIKCINNPRKQVKDTRLRLVLVLAFLIFVCFCFPQVISDFKLVILIVAFAVSLLFLIFRKKITINKTYLKFIAAYLIYSVYSALVGILNNNPGALDFARVNVVYYVVLFLTGFLVRTKRDFYTIKHACALSAIFISLYTFVFFLQGAGILQLKHFINIDPTSGVGIHEGYLHVTNMNLSMLIFLFPFNLFSIASPNTGKKGAALYLVATILSIPAMVISGRRIIWIVLAVSILLFIFGRGKKILKKRKVLFLVIAIVIATAIIVVFNTFDITIGGLFDRFNEAFSEIDELGGENVRLLQMDALFQGFLRRPLFGSGAGIGVAYVRSASSPWVYEMTYSLILYNSGIIGSLFFVLSLLYVLNGLLKRRRMDSVRKDLFYIFIICIVASATNPYMFSSFDFLFWTFIPLWYINSNKLKRRRRVRL